MEVTCDTTNLRQIFLTHMHKFWSVWYIIINAAGQTYIW